MDVQQPPTPAWKNMAFHGKEMIRIYDPVSRWELVVVLGSSGTVVLVVVVLVVVVVVAAAAGAVPLLPPTQPY